MMSRPNFEVDIIKSNGRTLSFTCVYVHPEMADEGGEAAAGNIYVDPEMAEEGGEAAAGNIYVDP